MKHSRFVTLLLSIGGLILVSGHPLFSQTNAIPSPALVSRANATLKALAQDLPSVPETIQEPIKQMLALPLTGGSRMFLGTQKAMVEEYRESLIRQITNWFVFDKVDAETCRKQLLPLVEKVGGFDSFGMRIRTGDLDGYLRANSTHIYISFAIPTSFVEKAGNPVTSLSASEVDQLDAIDRKRYEIAQIDAESLDSLEGRYVEQTAMRLANWNSLKRVTVENPNCQLALKVLRLFWKDPMVLRFHWNTYEFVGGIYGDTVVSFRPPPGPEYVQDVKCGFIVRFFVPRRADLVAFCFSRGPDVFRRDAIFKQPPMLVLSPDWFGE